MYELVRRFDMLVGDVRPDLVLTHSADDLHWAHILVQRATVSALRRTPCDLLAYLSSPEMSAQTSSVGNCFANITDSIEAKLEAIRCHASQRASIDVDASRDLARAMGRLCGYPYAEAFAVLRARI